MPVNYDKEKRTFKLDTATSSYIIQVYEENYLLNLYYGPWIPETYIEGRQCRRQNASFSLANPVIGEHGFYSGHCSHGIRLYPAAMAAPAFTGKCT